MLKYIFWILISISGLIDFWMFLKITHIKFQLDINGLLIVATIAVGTIVGIIIEKYGVFISNLIEIIGYYLIYGQKNRKKLVFGTIILICDLDLINDIVTAFITAFVKTDISGYVSLIFIISVITFINKFNNKIYNAFMTENSRIFIYILCYILISSYVILVATLVSNNYVTFYILSIILFIFQIIFLIIAYHELINIQKSLITEQRQKQLQEYADYLEKSEDDLRAFRHDYRNILNSLKISAQEGNVQEVIQKLDKYTKTNLNSQALLKYKDVNHIQVKSVKSIIITKLAEMYSLQIPYNFECHDNVSQIPDGINELDLVRIIGITIDNAIEESKAILKSAGDAKVQIMVYSSNPNEFEYEIRNKIRDRQISTSQIQKRGFTTKNDHQGLGLANIREMEDKYPDLSVSYTVEDGWFDFYMVIDEDEVSETND